MKFNYAGSDAQDIWLSMITGYIYAFERDRGKFKKEVGLAIVRKALEYPHYDQDERVNSLMHLMDDCEKYSGAALNYEDFMEICAAISSGTGRTLN